MTKRSPDLLSHLVQTMDLLTEKGRSADAATASALELSLDGAELAALRWIGPRGAVTMRSVAEGLGIVASSATTLIDRMVDKEVVQRDRDEVDRRIVLVSLAPQGKAIWRRSSTERARLCSEMLANFNPAEQQVLAELLGRMNSEPTPDPVWPAPVPGRKRGKAP